MLIRLLVDPRYVALEEEVSDGVVGDGGDTGVLLQGRENLAVLRGIVAEK